MKNLFPRSIKSSASSKKSTLSRIFFDTFDYCEEDDTLSKAVKSTVENQTVILESDPLQIQLAGFQSPAEVIVSDKRCIEAASSYARKGQKVCVLNFASAGVTGGGVKEGESALEESICRISIDALLRVLSTYVRRLSPTVINITIAKSIMIFNATNNYLKNLGSV